MSRQATHGETQKLKENQTMEDLNTKARREFLLETAHQEIRKEQERREDKLKKNAGYLIAFNIMLVLLALSVLVFWVG